MAAAARSTGHGLAPAGRLGRDRALVPPGVISVTICEQRGRTLTASYQALVTALNALPTHSSTRSCTMDPRLHDPG